MIVLNMFWSLCLFCSVRANSVIINEHQSYFNDTEIRNVIFEGCQGSDRGGAFDATCSAINITGCLFNNCIGGLGGSGYFENVDTAKIELSNVTNSRAQEGGAFFFKSVSHIEIRFCTFDNCVSTEKHGTISTVLAGYFMFINNIIENTPGESKGDALYIDSDLLHFDSNTFRFNTGSGINIVKAEVISDLEIIGNSDSSFLLNCQQLRNFKMRENTNINHSWSSNAAIEDARIEGNTNCFFSFSAKLDLVNSQFVSNEKCTITLSGESELKDVRFDHNTGTLMESTVPVAFSNVDIVSCSSTEALISLKTTRDTTISGIFSQNSSALFELECTEKITISSIVIEKAITQLTLNNCRSACVENCIFRESQTTALYSEIPTRIADSRFEKCCGDAAVFVTGSSQLIIQRVDFMFNYASSSLTISNVRNASISDSLFVLDRSNLGAIVSVLLETGSKEDTIQFKGCCFNTTIPGPHDGAPAHLHSKFVGSLEFVLPMCFDLPKDESVLFEGAPDPSKGMDIFNCIDCRPLPFTESETADASRGWEDVVLTGTIAGSAVIIVFITVGVVMITRRGKQEANWYPNYTNDNAAMASNLLSNPN